jgi:hypothetical protein
MHHYDLSKTYEFEGHWWISGSQVKFPGKLSLSPDGIELKVYGPYRQLASWTGYSDNEQGQIIGQSINGILITLNNAFSAGSGHHSSSNDSIESYAHCKIVANQCFIGQHVLDSDAVVDGDFYINFPHLEKWFEFNPYDTDHDIKNSTFSCVIKTSEQLINTEIPVLKTNLESFHSVTLSHGTCEGFHSDCHAYLFLKAGHSISSSKAMQNAHEITDLWSLLCGAYIAPRHVYFSKITEVDGQIESYQFDVYAPLDEHAFLDKIDSRDMLAAYPIVKDDIGGIFNKWFVDAEKMRAVRALFFKSFRTNRQRHYSIEQFLNYMGALDIFSRDFEANAILPADQKKNLSKLIADVITANINDKEISEKVSRNIHKVFSTTLEDNITLLAATLSPDTLSAFSILDKAEIGRLVKTRNFYTHYRNPSKNGILSEGELFKVIDQLMLLIILLLLRSLGIEEKVIMVRFQKIWSYHFALKWPSENPA